MRTAILGASAAVVACGCALAPRETEGERGIAEAREPASTFTAPWSTSHYMRTRSISAPLGGTITVFSKADFADRVGCPTAYSVELIRFASNAEEVVGLTRAYPLNQQHSEIWTALAGGTYK